MHSKGEPCVSPENKGEHHSFIEKRKSSEGLSYAKSSLEESGSSKCSGFSLAE